MPIDPTPDILIRAGELRDTRSTNPSDPKCANPRVIGTPDSIHLTSCLHVRDVLGVSDVVFHTFDKGRGVSWEGRCVPLIGFERWYPSPAPGSHAAAVCGLSRKEPPHPQTEMLGARPEGVGGR